jgi:hypothetical protein
LSSISAELIAYAQEKRLTAQTRQRWLSWPEGAQVVFLPAVKELQLNENQLRDFLDWLEEITARDGNTVSEVLAHPEVRRALEAKLSRNDKLKVVKSVLRKIRYPRLSRLEDELRAAVKALDLGDRVRISFPPALEGDEVTLEIKAHNVEEVRYGLTLLQRKIEDGSLRRVFQVMDEA